jgi:excisionase family DNA binding protein
MEQGGEKAEKMLRVDQVAKRLHVSERHVRRLIDQGKLAAHRFSARRIRIPESALEKFSWWINRVIRDKVPPNQLNYLHQEQL